MFKKSGSSYGCRVKTDNKFSVGNKVCLGSVNWTIMEAFNANSTDMVKITNVAGDEEIMTLATLIKDAEIE